MSVHVGNRIYLSRPPICVMKAFCGCAIQSSPLVSASKVNEYGFLSRHIFVFTEDLQPSQVDCL